MKKLNKKKVLFVSIVATLVVIQSVGLIAATSKIKKMNRQIENLIIEKTALQIERNFLTVENLDLQEILHNMEDK